MFPAKSGQRDNKLSFARPEQLVKVDLSGCRSKAYNTAKVERGTAVI